MTSARTDAKTEQSDMIAVAYRCSSHSIQNFHKECPGLRVAGKVSDGLIVSLMVVVQHVDRSSIQQVA